MRFVRRRGSTRGQGTRRALARRDPPLWEIRGERGPRRNRARLPATDPAPEARPTPPAGPGVDPAAPATFPGAAVGVGGGDVEEDGHALVAAHIEVTGVTVGPPVEVIPEVAHINAVGDSGQTPTTAIPVGVGVRAGDEGAGEVTATGAQAADPGRPALPVAVLSGTEVAVAAVGTAEPAAGCWFKVCQKRSTQHVWTLCTHAVTVAVIISHRPSGF